MAGRKTIVVGGSMAGLFAANMLHRAGWSVSVLERSDVPLSSRGAGIVTHAGMLALLQHAGVPAGSELGVAVRRRVSFDRRGRVTADIDFPQILMGWSRLHALLSAALPPECYELKRWVQKVRVGSADKPAQVLCSDGRQLEADLVVAADGVRSTLRGAILPDEPAQAAPYVAWRGMVPKAELSRAAQRRLGEVFVMVSEPGNEMISYPVLGDDGRVHLNFVWYRRVTPAQRQALFTDASGVYHRDGISPRAIRSHHLARARAQATVLFHSSLAELVEASGELLLQQIVDQQASTMCRGRLALVGDAAFVARPHVGQGVTKAGGDAWALTQCVSGQTGKLSDALRHYSRLRVPVGERAVLRARELGAVLLPLRGRSASMRAWARHYENPTALLADTAVELPGLAHVDPAAADVP